MKIAIIENEKRDQEILQNHISMFMIEKNINYSFLLYSDIDDFFSQIYTVDLVFLDIELDTLNGIQIGKEIRERNNYVKIIIVSNYSKYLIDGYTINADGYLLKPIKYNHFKLEFTRIVSNYLLNSAILLDDELLKEKVLVANVLYIEYSNRKCTVFLESGKQILTQRKLKYWIDKLSNFPFSRIYKSILVNLQHISEIENDVVRLSTNAIIPLSRHYKKSFESEYIRFIYRR